MKTAKDLTRDELEQLVTNIQCRLWEECDHNEETDDFEVRWNVDKEWDSGDIEGIAEEMARAGLRPGDNNQ